MQSPSEKAQRPVSVFVRRLFCAPASSWKSLKFSTIRWWCHHCSLLFPDISNNIHCISVSHGARHAAAYSTFDHAAAVVKIFVVIGTRCTCSAFSLFSFTASASARKTECYMDTGLARLSKQSMNLLEIIFQFTLRDTTPGLSSLCCISCPPTHLWVNHSSQAQTNLCSRSCGTLWATRVVLRWVSTGTQGCKWIASALI